MRSLQELSKLIYKGIEYTNTEQNEDSSFGIVLDTIINGRDKNRLERFIKKFELTNEEVNLLKNNISFFYD
jgi:hypothetical protein